MVVLVRLDGFEHGGLVGAQFLGDRSDHLLAADGDDGEAGSEGFQAFDCAQDVGTV